LFKEIKDDNDEIPSLSQKDVEINEESIMDPFLNNFNDDKSSII